MSQKIFLVKYILEDDIPIDETSENLQSTYIPDELLDWLKENKCSCEIEIKESKGGGQDIPVTIIDNSEKNCIQDFKSHVENMILKHIQDTNQNFSDGVLVSKEIDKDFKKLLIWLQVRELLKEKEEKYIEDSNVKVVVG
jgi:hypothetical protein